MHAFGKGFGQSIRECLGHDRQVVIIQFILEFVCQFIAADASRDRKRTEIIVPACTGGGDIVGE